MIDPITGWFEITQYNEKNDDNPELSRNDVSNQVYLSNRNHIYQELWFIGSEFKNRFILLEFGIKAKQDSSVNQKADAITERINQVLGNLVCT